MVCIDRSLSLTGNKKFISDQVANKNKSAFSWFLFTGGLKVKVGLYLQGSVYHSMYHNSFEGYSLCIILHLKAIVCV